jgi:hypothetical protein
MATILSVLSAYEGADVRRLHPQHGIWELVRPGFFARSRRARIARFEACRAEVLRELLAAGSTTFIEHQDPPSDGSVPGRWRSASERTWIVPSGFSAEERATALWLASGCWFFYEAPRAAGEPWPDVFRLPPETVIRWLAAHEVRAAVASFHDDAEWRVMFRSA